MKRTVVGLVFLAGFVAGCVAASRSLVVPPVRAGATPQNWEYKCVRYAGLGAVDAEDIQRDANALGAAGFEMTGTLTHTNRSTLCFKRPQP